MKSQFDGVPDDEIEMMTHTNAEALFHFPLSQRLIEAHSTPSF